MMFYCQLGAEEISGSGKRSMDSPGSFRLQISAVIAGYLP
jgi:hypothetical protein